MAIITVGADSVCLLARRHGIVEQRRNGLSVVEASFNRLLTLSCVLANRKKKQVVSLTDQSVTSAHG